MAVRLLKLNSVIVVNLATGQSISLENWPDFLVSEFLTKHRIWQVWRDLITYLLVCY